LIIGDGAEFVKDKLKDYDVAIVDSPDPIGPGKTLFQDKFYHNLSNLLRQNGIMVRQSGSSFFQKKELQDNYARVGKFFKYSAVYTAAVPTYIGGLFTFIFCSSGINPGKINLKTLKKRFTQLKSKTRYYNPEIHSACFQLPNYIKEILR